MQKGVSTTGRRVTVTARRADIPLSFLNQTGKPVTVHVHLASEKLLFPDGAEKVLVLPEGTTTQRFAVEARASGTFTMTVSLATGDGVVPLGEPEKVSVRSAVFSGAGAALDGRARCSSSRCGGRTTSGARGAPAAPSRRRERRGGRALLRIGAWSGRAPSSRSARCSHASRGSCASPCSRTRSGQATLADTYNLANTTPNIVYELLIGGVLSATLVPVFVDHLERRDERATSAVFTVTMTALVALTAVAMLFAPLIARLYSLDATGAERAAQLEVMTFLIRCFLPQMFFYGFTALASALLNARRRFAAAAYAPVLNNVVVVCVLLAFARVAAGPQAELDERRAHPRRHRPACCFSGWARPPASPRWRSCSSRRCSRAGAHLRFVFDWRHEAVQSRRAVVGMDGRVRRHESARAAVRADPRVDGRRR